MTLLDDQGLLAGPGGRPLTAEQAEAVRRRTGGVLLSANAGSGKTSVLVERIVRTVVEDGVRPGSVLAVTFTEKAAGEMRSRVRARFAELGRADLAVDSEGVHVSTIHGLCTTVLRAHAAAAGLDPDFRVLDEREARRLREAAFERALASFLNGPGREAALDLVAAYGVDRVAAIIGGARDELRSRGRTVRLPVPAAPPAPDPTVLGRAAAEALACLAGVTGVRVGTAVAGVQALADVLASGREPSPRELEAATFAAGGAKALGAGPCLEYLSVLDAHARAVRDSRAVAALALLDDLLVRAESEYAQSKEQAGGADFDDLQLRTRDLLVDRPALAAALRERHERLLVDEFQDTNPLQADLLGALGGDAFEVGDENQAIYGFRHADVRVMQERRARREAEGAALELATNFRSAPELLGTLNALFVPLLGDGFTALRAGREDPTALPGPRVELHVTATDGEWDAAALRGGLPDAQPWRHAEARHVARRVREIVEVTHLRARDVVVLLRAATAMDVFDQALADEGLDTVASASAGWWGRQQVLDLCAHLAVLANPREEEALFSLLASPLVGLSSDGLRAVADAHPRGERFRALELAAAGRPAPGLEGADGERLAGFAAWFATERAGSARRGLDELIERAVTARDYDLHVLALPGGRRRLANVLKLQRLAAQAQARLGRDVRAFIDLARAELDAEARELDAPVDVGDQDAVRLMTIHAAKGLEFPCVVVADLGRQGAADRPDLVLGDDGRVGLRLCALDLPRSVPALDHEELCAARLAAAHAEERRVHYVAMTRAEELLVLSGAADLGRWPADGPGRPPIGWIGRGLVPDITTRLEGPEADAVIKAEVHGHALRLRLVRNAPGDHPQGPPGHDGGGQLTLHLPEVAPDVLDPIPAPPTPGAASLSYTSLSAYAACPYRWYLQRVLRLPRDERDRALAAGPDAPSGGFDALFRGSLVHRLLEDLDPAAESPPGADPIRELAAVDEVELTDAEVADVQGLVAAYLGSALRERVRAATWVARERPFAFPAGEGQPLVNGILDLVAREPDGGWLVVDFKTDVVAEHDDLEVLVGRSYGVQRRIYALACLHAGASEVEVAHLYLARPRAPAVARYVAGDRGRLEAELLGVARGLLDGAFGPTPHPHRGLCLGCPGRRGLCSHPEELTLREMPEEA